MNNYTKDGLFVGVQMPMPNKQKPKIAYFDIQDITHMLINFPGMCDVYAINLNTMKVKLVLSIYDATEFLKEQL